MAYLTELSDVQLTEFRLAYKTFAKDADAPLPTKDIAQCMRSLGYYPTEAELEAFIEQHDPENMKWIDMPTWLTIMNQKAKEERENEESIISAFRVFDKEDNGFISASGLKQVLQTLGETLTDEEMGEMLMYANIDEDNMI